MATTYEPIATATPSSTYTVDFTSIPSTYTDLRIVIFGRSATGGGTSSEIFMKFNNDSGSNYSRTNLSGDGATAFSSNSTSQTEMTISPGVAGSSTASDIFSLTTLDILLYAGSTNKTVLGTCSLDRNGAGTERKQVFLWRNTSAINRVTLTDAANNNWASGTTITLYGIKAA
jgi:hypothetical protein